MAGALAELVEARRVELSMSYRELARATGMSPTAIHKISTGAIVTTSRPATLNALAQALELPIELLNQAVATDLGVRSRDGHDDKLNGLAVAAGDLREYDLDLVIALVEALRRKH